jgi:hypothetical protein
MGPGFLEIRYRIADAGPDQISDRRPEFDVRDQGCSTLSTEAQMQQF